ncbi:target of Nesh-SH3-like isoform X2 [Betta splendens]|uniref:Target of Nesh-SH3-like isoform X2 n=1 Tax=Betta splendens TaxID=158456 RepID=A0A6P7LWG8_BETSP|nr:target of Nesh-SH3-like isoform X2 [Betta splendens]
MASVGLLRVLVLLMLGMIFLSAVSAQRIRAHRQHMKVRINATGDTIVMKFVRPSPDMKLEGYILGYGGSMFSKQFIQLPENGKAYETELDAEPKYLVAVQPIPASNVKKQCTGKVNLEKPLHLVIGSISPTAVLLSWGNHLKMPYEGNIMNECLEDGFYTIRYRERNRKWTYQTCPTSDTVVDNLKPNTPYEFGVRSNKDERSSVWSKPVVHNTNMGNKNMKKLHKVGNPLTKPMKPSVLFPPRPAVHNWTHPRLSLLKKPGFPGAPRTSFDKGKVLTLSTGRPVDPPSSSPTRAAPAGTTPITKLPTGGDLLQNLTTQAPTNAPEKLHNPSAVNKSRDGSTLLRSALANERAKTNLWGQDRASNPSPTLPLLPFKPAATTVVRSMRPGGSSGKPLNPYLNGFRLSHPSYRASTSGVHGQTHRSMSAPKAALWPRPPLGSPARPSLLSKKTNLVGKPGQTDKGNNLKTDRFMSLQPKVPLATTKPTQPERKHITATAPTPATRQETWEDSDLFKSQPNSDVDALGKKRYVAPHVVYQTGKKPDEPCSITSSLNYFPQSEANEANVTSPPKTAPSNLTVVTVEGCPSFIILDWEKADNDTTEYEVISTAKGPDGEQVSVLTTNQTHTAVENLKPESSYEFKVQPKNELGAGPPSEPVSFNTESADPRVSENVSGKDAIWTQFPFKTDSYSDCHGKQYVKRTWYRKFVGVQLCNSLRYKIYLSDSLNGKFYNIGDQTGYGEDHCQFVDSFLDGRTGRQLRADHLPNRPGFYRAVRQEPVHFGQIGGHSHISYVSWYECGTPIPGKW